MKFQGRNGGATTTRYFRVGAQTSVTAGDKINIPSGDFIATFLPNRTYIY
jgi:hypothetical protein